MARDPVLIGAKKGRTFARSNDGCLAPKIKQFLWCIAQNSLAIKLNIKRCGMKLDIDARFGFALMKMVDNIF